MTIILVSKLLQNKKKTLFYFSVNNCSVPTVLNAITDIPSFIDYNFAVTYTCQYGFSHEDVDLTRTCKADRSLTGYSPVCASTLQYVDVFDKCYINI